MQLAHNIGSVDAPSTHFAELHLREEQLGEPRYATRQQHSEVTSSKVELSKTTISTLKAIKIKLVCA